MRYSAIFLCFVSTLVFAQDSITTPPSDLKFREDHFYFGIFFNSFIDKPIGFSQNKLSPGLQLGYIRDIPVNPSRTLALAPGLGLSYSSNNLNLIVSEQNQNQFFNIGSPSDFSKNRLILYSLDFPFELRWRNATPDSHRFFRVYTGFKLSYIFSHLYVNENSESTVRIRNLKYLERWTYGAYIAAGYNTWNFYLYYGLNRMFSDELNELDDPLRVRILSLGLQFYIL
jgi:hypothetical protein